MVKQGRPLETCTSTTTRWPVTPSRVAVGTVASTKASARDPGRAGAMNCEEPESYRTAFTLAAVKPQEEPRSTWTTHGG
jgi:hypothetical protein